MKTFDAIKKQLAYSTYKNAQQLMLVITVCIFTVELGIMSLLDQFFHSNIEIAAFVDASILTATLLPVLYFLFYRPYYRHVAELQSTERDLVRFATAIEQGQDAITMTKPDGTIQYINPAFTRITGYVWDEAVGARPSILKSGKHDDAFYKEMWETITGGDNWEGEFINRKKDGATYYAFTRITPVRDENGGIINFVAVMEDITLKKLADTEKTSYLHRLEELSRYNENLVEKAPIGAWIINFVPLRPEDESHDPCYRWHSAIGVKVVTERVNKAMAEMLGWNKLDLVGRSIFDPLLVDNENAQLYVDEIKRRRAGKRGSYDLQLIHAKGGRVHVLVEAVPVVTDPVTGGVLQSLGVFVNMTERKKMEEKIVQLMLEQKIILDTSPLGIALVVNQQLQWLNNSLCNVTGYGENDLRGSVAGILFPTNAEFRTTWNLLLTSAVRGDVFDAEQQIKRKDGTLFWARLLATAIDSGEPHRGILLIIEDITVRKEQDRVRDELIAALNRSNEELKEFAYIVSHDLKAPLRAIGSLAEWLANDYADRLDDEGKENLALLLGRTKRMNALIEGILRYSRLGRVKAEPEELDSARITRLVIAALAPPPDIKIQVSGELPTIMYDRTHLEQLLQNLLSNAIKHMGKPAGEVTVSCRDAGDEWEFCVADTGQGIDEKHFDRIFKIFQSLKARDEVESTGIGLTLVKKIAEGNGGKVWLQSTPGIGSRFYFTIPKTPPAQADETARTLSTLAQEKDT